MSGAGPGVDENGNLFFATGNSDPAGTSYDPVLNLCESVVEMSADLHYSHRGIHAHAEPGFSQPTLDAEDEDLGAGGVTSDPLSAVSADTLPCALDRKGRILLSA